MNERNQLYRAQYRESASGLRSWSKGRDFFKIIPARELDAAKIAIIENFFPAYHIGLPDVYLVDDILIQSFGSGQASTIDIRSCEPQSIIEIARMLELPAPKFTRRLRR
jgi:hypothetical protein